MEICTAQVAQVRSFAPSVPDLAVDCQRLIVVFDGLSGLAQMEISVTQVSQVVSFALPLPDLAADRQCLLVIFDGLSGIAQMEIGKPGCPSALLQRCDSPSSLLLLSLFQTS